MTPEAKKVGNWIIAKAYELAEFYSWRRENIKHWISALIVCALLTMISGFEDDFLIALGKALIGLFFLVLVSNLIVMLSRPQGK